MSGSFLVLAIALGFQPSGDAGSWIPFTSDEGKFVVDFPSKPTKSFTRQARSKTGSVKIVVVQCDTPDVLYTAEKVNLPPSSGLKPADLEAILDFWRDNLANEFNGRIVTQKKLRLGGDSYGRDFTVEGRSNSKSGLATIRVREYLSQKVLYILVAATAADRELPENVGHFFASFSPGTKRVKKVGPHPEADGTPLGDWGMAINPDNDCKIEDKGSALEISIPNTHHDLNADNDKLNAPRVVREVSGDFSLTVRVTGKFNPGAKSTNPKAVPYIGGGIVVWQDSNNYVFLGRAAINRQNKVSEFAAFEEREWGTRGAVNNRGIDPGGVYLRLERRNNRLMGYTSKDGQNWARLDPMEPTYPATLKVGLYGINGCADPVTMRFDNYKFTEGSGPANASSKAKSRTKTKR
jgi:regulation of enolase protein 1 (concanavalin A-like superfamily)